MRKTSVGAVVGRSSDRSESKRDEIIDRIEKEEKENPGLDLNLDDERPEEDLDEQPVRPKPKKRNHKHAGYEPDYFRELDEIMAQSYVQQEAAHNIVESFTAMLEARGIGAGFEDARFERAASNMAVIAMLRQMAWLFGLGPELSDRIAEHTVDRLFSPGHVTAPGVKKA